MPVQPSVAVAVLIESAANSEPLSHRNRDGTPPNGPRSGSTRIPWPSGQHRRSRRGESNGPTHDQSRERVQEQLATEVALALRGRAAVAQARLAYRLFRDRFAGERGERLAAGEARLQRPLWASTSPKNPASSDTLYVDGLIGPDTVNTLPEATIAAFEYHGAVARKVDAHLEDANAVMARLATVGVDIGDVGLTLEE